MTLDELEQAVQPNPQLQLTQKTYLLIDCEILGKAWPKLIAIARAAKEVVDSYNLASRPGNGGEQELQEALEDLEKN